MFLSLNQLKKYKNSVKVQYSDQLTYDFITKKMDAGESVDLSLYHTSLWLERLLRDGYAICLTSNIAGGGLMFHVFKGPVWKDTKTGKLEAEIPIYPFYGGTTTEQEEAEGARQLCESCF